MKITLIKPTMGTKSRRLYVDEGRMEPLQLGVIAALIPSGIEVVLVDDRMEQIPYDDPTDAVLITVETFTAKRAYEISAQYRSRNIPVIMGGMHVKLAPEEVMEHCTSAVSGDAENIFPAIIRDLQAKKLRRHYDCGLADPPQPGLITRRDLFAGKGYLPISLMQFSRGCIHGCSYCAGSVYFGQKHYCRAIDEVVAEIKAQKRRHIFFVDDNFVADTQRAKALCRALMPLKINWVSQGTVSMTADDELMRLIVASGGMGFVMGFESLNPQSLSLMNKDINKKPGLFDQYTTEVAQLRKYGLQTWAAFTVGHDTDTVDGILQTVEWALKNKFTFAAFNILMPYPQTPLYKQLEAQGRLLYDGKWWLHEDYRFNHAAFIPKNMTAHELTALSFHCRRRFNTPLSVLYRSLEPQTNMRTIKKFVTYWLYNPLFRKEVHKKQGLKLGLDHFKEGTDV